MLPTVIKKNKNKITNQNKTLLLSPLKNSHTEPPITTATNGGGYPVQPELKHPLSLSLLYSLRGRQVPKKINTRLNLHMFNRIYLY